MKPVNGIIQVNLFPFIVIKITKSSFLSDPVVIYFADGFLCFNIRVTELDDYQEMMLELEKAGRWSLFSKKRLPFSTADDMPKETSAFLYKVLKNEE